MTAQPSSDTGDQLRGPGHARLPEGYRLRRPVAADARAVCELKRAVEIALHGDSDTMLSDVLEEWALPRLAPARDLWVVDGPADALVAYGLFWLESAPEAPVAEQTVHPGHRGRGLSAALLDLGEGRAAETAAATPPGVPVNLGVWAHETDSSRVALYEGRGYERVRSFVRLDRDLSAPVKPPEWPAGVVVRAFRRGQDEAAVHTASFEAFLDHFRPAVMTLDEWVAFRFARGDLDPALWAVAWDGDEVAGAALALETPTGGYIDELFVRRPWRGRGLGRALLLYLCAELRRRGRAGAHLGVDTTNPTGAMQLYGSAGFEAHRGTTLFLEKDFAVR